MRANRIINYLTNKKVVTYIFIFTTILILFATLYPFSIESAKIKGIDKAAHLLMFFLWTLALGSFLYLRNKKRASSVKIILYSILFGIAVEFSQHFMRLSRNAEFLDLLFNIIGTLIAVFLLKKIYPPSENNEAG